KLKLPEHELAPPDPSAALKGTREASWEQLEQATDSPVYAYDALLPGHCIEGPALVEADFLTLVVSPGNQLSIDTHGIALLQPDSSAPSHQTGESTTALKGAEA